MSKNSISPRFAFSRIGSNSSYANRKLLKDRQASLSKGTFQKSFTIFYLNKYLNVVYKFERN
jgi:hypothetical protein